MPVDLGPEFRTDFAGIPPHLSQNDLRLWESFRRRFAGDFRRFFFDVALGRGQAVGPGVSPNVAAAWRRLTRFRADVVADTPEAWTIIEIRPNAGPGAIGSLQVYTSVWFQDPPDRRPLRALLVTDDCTEDIIAVAGVVGIELRCLGGNSGGLA